MKTIFRYTDEQLDFLRTGYLIMNIRDLTPVFNKRFGTEKTETAIKAALNNHHILCGREPKDRLIDRHKRRLLNQEQEQFVRENYKIHNKAVLTRLFNDRFGTRIKQSQIRAYTWHHHIKSGRTGQFPKGHKTWNKGTKGLTGRNRGTFKKGNIPPNRKPLWTERIESKDGYIRMKVPEKDPYTGFSTRYKCKHIYIWEQKHGPVPKGMVVAFIDGDKTHCELDNLMCISQAENMNLNSHGYRDMPAELKPYVLALSKLQVMTWAKQKHLRGKGR